MKNTGSVNLLRALGGERFFYEQVLRAPGGKQILVPLSPGRNP